VLDELDEHAARRPGVTERDVVPPRARSRFLVDEVDAEIASAVECVLDVVGRERDVMDAALAVREVPTDRTVLAAGFEQFHVPVPGVEEQDVQVVHGFHVDAFEFEEIDVQVRERVGVGGRDAGVIEVHTGRCRRQSA